MRRLPSPVLSLVLAAACWGVGTVVSKQALDEIAPVTLLVVQLTISVVFLATMSTRSQRTRSAGCGRRQAMALGLLNPGLSYALALVGLSSIAASTSVLIWASEPALIVILALIILREKLTPRLWFAISLALAGVLLVVYTGGFSGSPVGVVLTLGAVLACAVYTILARIWAVDDAALSITLNQQTAALVFALVLVGSLALLNPSHLTGPTAFSDILTRAWAAALISGLMYYALAFWFYLSALRHVQASVAGSFLTLVPVFGVAAAMVTGERLDVRQWIGAALVVASVAVIASASGQVRVVPVTAPEGSTR
ncbi:MAG: DMT family transporter [Actinomycetes bacterium]